MSASAFSQTLTLNQSNPIALMHMLPAGEAPGWIDTQWFELEVLEANFWAKPANFKNLETGKTLTYTSAFEQTLFFLEYGRAITPKLAFEVQMPILRRTTGNNFNNLISGYHHTFGFDAFERDDYRDSAGSFETSTNGVERRPSNVTSGFSNVKVKLKYWFVHWRKDTGLGLNFQIKTPIVRADTGLTSGSVDYSLLLHLACPIGQESFFYSTLGATYAPQNWLFQDWPRQKLLWMVDFLFELPVFGKWNIILDQSFQSPLMHKGELQYTGLTQPTGFFKEDRMASGLNSLVHFRGQEMIGLKRNFRNEKNFWMIYFAEDFGIGDRDETGDISYSNNQPDIGLGTKVVWYF